MNDYIATDWSPEALKSPDEAMMVQRLEARVFNHASPPPTPEPRFYLGRAGICTPDNLTAISAAVKSGKSGFLGAMMAAVLTSDYEKHDCLGLRSENPHQGALIHIDTEQSPYDHHDLIVRVLKRVGLSEPPPWFRSYCLTGFPCYDIRSCVRLAMEQGLNRFGSVHSILVDGVADLVADVNEPEACNGLVSQLHGWAIEFRCPIISVIHLNPGAQDKTRGHLGSQLERKSETNLRLEKLDGTTVVWSDKNRRAPILKSRGPCFSWSDEKGMHVSVPNIEAVREQERLRKLRDLAEAVFAAAERPSLTWKECIEGIQKIAGTSEPTARKKFDALRQGGALQKSLMGRYQLA
jgi:hypothetical protein